jgi:hypothetical protein
MSLGVDKKTNSIKNIFTKFSKSDFYHDFSINKEPIIKMLQKSVPLNLTTSKVKYLRDVMNLHDKLNNNIYDFFRGDYTLILPDGSNAEALNEDKLLKSTLDIDYVALRRMLIDFTPELANRNLPETIPFTIDDKEDLKRNYEISFYPAKNGKIHYNLPQAFKSVSGKNKFVLIIDASFLSMSTIGLEEYLKNEYIAGYDSKEEYEFYILENNENLSDSATKIKKYDNNTDNIKIFFLREEVNSQVTYPSFNTNSQASNLYTSVELTTTKQSNRIDGVVRIDGKEFQRSDIGKISEIDQSAFYALQSYILNGNKTNEETMSYFLLKRAGDWCQALSLLDTSRVYKIYNVENKSTGTITLGELQLDCTVAVVTHDRILLGYSLLLGLNVFYSMRIVKAGDGTSDSNSVIWLSYFKNLDNSINISDYSTILNHKDSNLTKINEYTLSAETVFNEFISETTSINFSNPVEDVIKFRRYLTLMNELYTKEYFELKKEEIVKLYSEIENSKYRRGITDENKKVLSSKLSSIRSLLKLFDIMSKRNSEIKNTNTYDNEVEERRIASELYSLNKSREIPTYQNEYKRVIVEKIKEEYLELKSKNIHTEIRRFVNNIPEELNERDKSNRYKRLLLPLKRSIEQEMNVEGGYKQSGGDIDAIIGRLKDTQIPEHIKDSNIKLYNDESGNFYTHYDDYLITKSKLQLFKEGLELLRDKQSNTFNASEKYLYTRFILFYLDELFTDLFSLTGQIQYEKNKPQFEDELFLNFLRIDFQLDYISKIVHSSEKIDSIIDTYFVNREKWGAFFLLGELHRLERIKKGSRYNFSTIADRIENKLEVIKSSLLRIENVFINSKSRKRARSNNGNLNRAKRNFTRRNNNANNANNNMKN